MSSYYNGTEGNQKIKTCLISGKIHISKNVKLFLNSNLVLLGETKCLFWHHSQFNFSCCKSNHCIEYILKQTRYEKPNMYLEIVFTDSFHFMH